MGYLLTAFELELTQEKIDEINRRAARRGLSGKLEVVAEQKMLSKEVGGITVTEERWETSITGEPPRHNGWVFLASLEWIETGVITRNAPGTNANVERATLRPGFCDHCGYNRKRKQTYVVLNEETGQQMQVGSTCLKDFLGWSGSVAFLTEEDGEREIMGFRGRGPSIYTTETILAVAWACVTTFGYIRSREAGATVGDVALFLSDSNSKEARKLRDRISEVARDAVPMAQKLRAFILSDEFAGDSDYVINLKTYCAADTVNGRAMGYLASVPQAYAKHLERTLIRERANADRKNEWIGTLKTRQTFNVKVRAIKWLEDLYNPYGGSKPLYTLITDTGHTLKWFASNDNVLGEDVTPENEDFFPLMGTVVKHEEYNGYKSTCINRCKKL